MTSREAKSFCRICAGFCGMTLTIDEQDRIIAIRGDKKHPLTRGYACIKGLQAPEAHHGKRRLLHPLKRLPDGSFVRVPLEQALDEIAQKLELILDRDGPEALAAFRGTINVFSAANSQMVSDWLTSLGSHGFYTTMTIDQSAKWVTVERLGMWAAARQSLRSSDVCMLIGINPLVSIGGPGLSSNPSVTLREARARGLKLIVIDPRRTETAQHADVFLQPYPGEDPTVAAGLLRIIFEEGWEDKEFCARYVNNLDGLRQAVKPFTPEYVEHRAGVPGDKLREAAALFAHIGKRGIAHAGTGVTMAPHSNLSDHLYDCLNVVCGRFLRPGEIMPNPGVMGAAYPRRAEVYPPRRSWESGYKSRIRGHGMLFGEMMTGVLADEILMPGKGQIRSLFVDGGNPVSAIPDQYKVVEAFRSLELLVTIDPYMTTTARLSHYILPPRVFYEHADLTPPLYETSIFQVPFASYTPAVIEPPPGSEVVEDWYVFWALAKRLGRTITYNGVPLNMERAPTIDELHALLLKDAMVPFAEMQRHAGEILAIDPVVVQPPGPDSTGRFEVCPPDVAEELAGISAEKVHHGGVGSVDGTFTHRLISRRLREVSNTMYHDIPAIQRRVPYNPAYMNPDDLAAMNLNSGDKVAIISDHGRITAIVKGDATVRSGVVSMTHGWGGLPDDGASYEQVGASTSLLISTDRDYDCINAMPRMSAVPVRIEHGIGLELSG